MNFESKEYYFSDNEETIVIAEVGVNHNGDLEIAKRMVDIAVKANVHAIKFQAFCAEKEISKYAAKAPYQKETTSSIGNQLEMCKALELSGSALKELKKYCKSKKMPFLCTAFDFESVDLLVDDLKVEAIKIPSGEITNIPFLQYIGSKKKGVILSTGASNLIETGIAVETLKNAGCTELILLHCVSSYPAPIEQVNLKAMLLMKEVFNLPVGFSDHTTGIQVAIAAAALGAVAIEKHFTLDKSMTGPDHRASIEPGELVELVRSVKIANLSLGESVKQAAPCELSNMSLIRKSIVAAFDLPKGAILSREMIEIKRPEGGINPVDIEKIIGLSLKKEILADSPICWHDLI